MRIGIPRERKVLEGRVGLVPAACADLVRNGHTVWLETHAGERAGYPDEAYRQVGVEVAPTAAEVYGSGGLIVKVKEPVEEDLELLRREHLLFCYLHLAANSELATRLQQIGLTAVGFETVQTKDGILPLLAPMSDIAGRLSVQMGCTLLYQPNQGKGLLLGGLPGAERGHVVIIGAGSAGSNAARVAAELGATVTVFDRKRERLAAMRNLGNNVTALYPYEDALAAAVRGADLLIGAVLIPGQRAPYLVSAELVREMEAGSVIVDISVDQGGCVETTRPTDYAAPTYIQEGVVHCNITNLPGAVPRSASQALSAALMPYVLNLAGDAWREVGPLTAGINVDAGELVHDGVRKALGAA